MAWKLLDTSNRTDHTKAQMFLDPNGGTTIARSDIVRHPAFERLTEKALGFFWRPQEIDVSADAADFKSLTDFEKHIFTSNIRRQIVLDGVQQAAPSLAFLPIVSLPEIEAWIQVWSFTELIHSRSYTHIIKNIYPNPSVVFDELLDVQQVVQCADDITEHYDRLIEMTSWYRLLGEGVHQVNGREVKVSLRDIKRELWLTLMSVNILEGIRFYVSFCCSFAFSEVKRMQASARIIKLICRDENIHLGSTQMMLKSLMRDDPEFMQIAKETEAESLSMFRSAVQSEKEWAKYLFKDGSIIGLNEDILCQYIEWICNKRTFSVGLPQLFKNRSSDPLPWMQKWIAGSDVQTAPQETEILSYVNTQTKNDVKKDTFKDFEL